MDGWMDALVLSSGAFPWFDREIFDFVSSLPARGFCRLQTLIGIQPRKYHHNADLSPVSCALIQLVTLHPILYLIS